MRLILLAALSLCLVPVVAGDSLFVTVGSDGERQFTVRGRYSVSVTDGALSFDMAPVFVFEDDDWTYTNVSAVSVSLLLENGSERYIRTAIKDAQLEPGDSVSASFSLPVDVPTEQIDGFEFGVNHTAVRPNLGKYFAVSGISSIRRYTDVEYVNISSNMTAVNKGEQLYIQGTTDASSVYVGGGWLPVSDGGFEGWVGTDSFPVSDKPMVHVFTESGAVFDVAVPARIDAEKPEVNLMVPNVVKEGEQMTIDVSVSKPVESLTVRWQDWELEASADGSFIVPTENESVGLYRFEVSVTDTDGITVIEDAGFEIVSPERYQQDEDVPKGEENQDDSGTDDGGGFPLIRGFRNFVEGLIERLLGL